MVIVGSEKVCNGGVHKIVAREIVALRLSIALAVVQTIAAG
jgi:hypothetical protein